MNILFVLLSLVGSNEPSAAEPNADAVAARSQFTELLKTHSDRMWTPRVPDRLREAIRAYDARARLGGGLTYGQTARTYALGNKCAAQIERDLVKLGCPKRVDVIREPVANEPIRDAAGRTAAIWQFVCADGSVIKVKPDGDPSSRYVPHPHASRTLRYPAETPYRDYRDEVAKVSEEGYVIPRGPADLGPKDLMTAWSREAHVPLGACH